MKTELIIYEALRGLRVTNIVYGPDFAKWGPADLAKALAPMVDEAVEKVMGNRVQPVVRSDDGTFSAIAAYKAEVIRAAATVFSAILAMKTAMQPRTRDLWEACQTLLLEKFREELVENQARGK
jgi:hypothetical protein